MPVACGDEQQIDDIEDLISAVENKSSKSKVENDGELMELMELRPSEVPCSHSHIPGTQKIFFKTWGCTHNTSDSEYMAGQLKEYGYQIIDEENKDEADLWILNSCTVKTPAEDHLRNYMKMAQGKPVVVAGCVPQGAPRSSYLSNVSAIGVMQIDRVVEVVEETLKGNTVRLFGPKKRGGKKLGGASLLLPKVRRNPLIEIIPISTGCLNSCTYCKTKHARGELGSYPVAEIVARAKQAFEEGVCELWLTSEDTGAYGRDIGTNLPELLWAVIDTIPDGCMLRLGMTNPPYIVEHLPEMAKILNHPRVYSFLHVPVQSASDGVLADMKREYVRSDFEGLVDFLREKVPEVNIVTDIICGFPTESEEDFKETLDLCRKYKFASLYINQFFPRPGTPAAKMERVPPAEVKKRTKQLTDLFLSYEPYSGCEGKCYKALVTELSHDRQHYVAHNKSYHQILVPKRADILGKTITVKITSIRRHCMIAEIIDVDPEEMAAARCKGTKLYLAEEHNNNISLIYPISMIALAVVLRMIWAALSL
ncbi:threonylcarbamoyladenosine tRNA methylthiotransferase [Neocloeon triangulifer]|uniref:threonylcarbamoyladenosine tRNA methylthiotransferase n=1 Tax=Neocloeon triangulifer TaxID=2078957 RepID=UPI00286EC802|nr:threonylcarbamoyladenosine tRNA methylthiotransferase [Neocloeon triangulifer]